METPANKAADTLAKLRARAVAFSDSRMPRIKAIHELLEFYQVPHSFIMGHQIRIRGKHTDGHFYDTLNVDSRHPYYSRNGWHHANAILELLPKQVPISRTETETEFFIFPYQ